MYQTVNAKQFALMVKEANYVAYRIRNSKTSSGSESSPEGSKTSCPSADEEISPSIRKHTRSGTFTKCPLELRAQRGNFLLFYNCFL
jgi:hypothetical protein